MCRRPSVRDQLAACKRQSINHCPLKLDARQKNSNLDHRLPTFDAAARYQPRGRAPGRARLQGGAPAARALFAGAWGGSAQRRHLTH
jgi:hypothetical protein